MSRVVLRPTIASDLPFVIDEPLPYRIKTITAVLYDALSDSRHDGGTVVGIGGLAFPPDGPAVAFAQVAPPLAVPQREGHPRTVLPVATRFPVAFHRAGLAVMQMIRDCGVREVVATADAGNEAAVRWLTRLGFSQSARQPIAGRVLFAWTPDAATTSCRPEGGHAAA
jgi:hypothetical protein